MSNDPFVRLVREAHAQREARETLYAREEQAAYWQSSHAVTARPYVTREACEAREARQATIARNVRTLVTRHTENVRRAARAGLDESVSRETASLAWWHRNLPYMKRQTLTSDSRKLVRLVRDAAVRETVTHAERVQLDQHTAAITTDMREGLTQARDVRVNTRGAYGKRAVRVQPAKRVTRRDNYMPVELLKPVVTVGVATHPDADGSDYDSLIRAIRVKPALATVRVYHGLVTVLTQREASDGRGTVKPATDYGLVTVKRTRDDRPSHVTREARDTRPEVLRRAETVGYIGNVD